MFKAVSTKGERTVKGYHVKFNGKDYIVKEGIEAEHTSIDYCPGGYDYYWAIEERDLTEIKPETLVYIG